MGHNIAGICGSNGTGKSLYATSRFVAPALRRGKPVVSNARLYPERIGCDPGLYVPLTSWMELRHIHDCVLFLDEITSVLPSRQGMSLPAEFQRLLGQFRKGDITVVWTGVAFGNADLLLRQATKRLTIARGMFADDWVRQDPTSSRFPRRARDEAGRPVREKGWRPNRLFSYLTYDAQDFEAMTDGKKEALKPMQREWYWRPGKPDQLVYETLENVGLMDHLERSTHCGDCGCRRRTEYCTCAHDGGATEEPAVGARSAF